MVVQCLGSGTIFLKPLNATFGGDSGRGKECVSECSNGNELEVKGRHLSKML